MLVPTALRLAYATAVDVESRGGTRAIDECVQAWQEWVQAHLKRRAESFEKQTGSLQAIEYDPAHLGPQTPLDGVRVEQSCLRAPNSVIFEGRIRDFQGDDRYWVTEFAAGESTGETACSIRMGVQSLSFKIAPPSRWVLRSPRLWQHLAARLTLRAGDCTVNYHEAPAHNGRQVDALRERLLSSDRTIPVVIVAVENAAGAPPVCPDLPSRLAEELCGLAEVHYLADSDTAWALSEAIREDHGCYNGAIRIYWPGFRPESRPSYRDLILPDRDGRVPPVIQVRAEVLRRVSRVAVIRYVEPQIVASARSECMTHQRAQERARTTKDLKEALSNELKESLAADAQETASKMIDEAIAEHERQIEELEERLVSEREEFSRQLAAVYVDANEADDVGDSVEHPPEDADLCIEYYAHSSGRRPVLDFADEEYGKDRAGRRAYLGSLVRFPQWWGSNVQRFDKVNGASVADRKGAQVDIWDYRALQRQGGWVRVLFARVDPDRALLLHSVSKRQNRLDQVDIETAKQRLKEYLK